MNRLFVALRPPAPIRRALCATMGGIAGARWQRDDQLHVTLRFIGDVDRHQSRDVMAVLGAVHIAAMTLETGDIGWFDKKGRIDAIWVRIVPAAPVTRLHLSIDRALRAAGIAPDQRAFIPHLTLARFSRGQAPSIAAAAAMAPPPALQWEAGGFTLYRSHLTGAGSVYEPIAAFPLAGAGAMGAADD